MLTPAFLPLLNQFLRRQRTCPPDRACGRTLSDSEGRSHALDVHCKLSSPKVVSECGLYQPSRESSHLRLVYIKSKNVESEEHRRDAGCPEPVARGREGAPRWLIRFSQTPE